MLNLAGLFSTDSPGESVVSIRGGAVSREKISGERGHHRVIDWFSSRQVACIFLRFQPAQDRRVILGMPGNYHVLACAAGGWLALPAVREWPSYWIPRAPVFRSLDPHGHVLAEQPAEITGFSASDCLSSIEIESSPEFCLDWLAWRIPAAETELLDSLQHLNCLERQPMFLWGSHTRYRRPVDVYEHLIFGHVYENRYLLPYQRKSCSENDAHTLYVTLAGLERATQKKIYSLLKDQLLLSVLARQASDGGWHHGEWSEAMEAHLRLNGSATHLLMDSLDERDDPAVRQALERAVSFVARHRDETAVGRFAGQIKERVARKAIAWLEQNAPDWLPSITVSEGKTVRKRFWQPGGGYDRNITSTEALRAMIEYFHANPVRRGLVARAEDWQWSSARWYARPRPVRLEMDQDVLTELAQG